MNVKSIISTILILGAVVAGVFYLIKINSISDPQINYHPQREKVFEVDGSNAKPINIVASTLPKFAIDVNKQEFSNVWKAGETPAKDVVYGEVIGSIRSTPLEVKTQVDEKNKQVYVTPENDNHFKPGLYKLNVTLKTVQGKEVTITQDFTWGVLAINPNKATYQVGEKVAIGMGVLDDYGNTKCIAKGTLQFQNAKVWLTITSPSGKETNVSTDDGSIAGSPDCGPKTVTNNADFQVETTADEVGKYKLHMEAETINGRRSLDDSFAVKTMPEPFIVERTSYPTRIYPKADYPVTITVKANQDYRGSITDIVPTNFQISDISDGGRTIIKKDYQEIIWNADWQNGSTHILKYTIHFPPVSPEFYLVGPLTIGSYSEERNWQIASDAVWTLIQEKNNTTASAQNVSATFTSAIGQSHLVIVNCYRTNGDAAGGFLSFTSGGNAMSIGSPAGYSTAENNSNSTTNGATWMFYKLASASETTTIQCKKNDDNPQNGPMGIEIMEFSGGSNTITLDSGGGSHANTDQNTVCQGAGSKDTTATVTPTNTNSLIMASHYATAANRTVINHSPGAFTDADATGGLDGFFNATAGSYDGAYIEDTSLTAEFDTANLSGNGTACGNVIATFNTAANLSQSSYQFFDESNNITPGTALAGAQNTPVTLKNPRFRLRLLMDNDSPSGTTLGLNGGHWKLQFGTMVGSCSAATVFSDVTNSSTIAYAATSVTAVSSISSATGDPVDAGYTTRLENYYDDLNSGGSPPYITDKQLTIASGQAGLWDFSLIDNTPITTPTTYCFQVINTNGTLLQDYKQYPQLTSVNSHVNFFGGTKITGGTTVF